MDLALGLSLTLSLALFLFLFSVSLSFVLFDCLATFIILEHNRTAAELHVWMLFGSENGNGGGWFGLGLGWNLLPAGVILICAQLWTMDETRTIGSAV